MISRKLLTIGTSKALIIEPFLIEYLGLEADYQVEISIEGDKLSISRLESTSLDEGLTQTSNHTELVELIKNNDKKGAKRSHHIRSFFNDGRLKIGDKVIYYQAIEEGKTDKKDKAIIAEVIDDANNTRQYLRSLGDGKVYSLSGLRTKLIEDYGVKNVHPKWGHTLTEEWRELNTMKKLSEL